MALVLNDRVKETTTSTGTGTINLAGAETGFETFVAGVGNSNTCYYCIAHQSANEFEVGLGTVTDASPDTLSRTTIISSSNSDSAVNFSAGTKDVFCTLPASKVVFENGSDNVGIGTASPTKKLHVEMSGDAALFDRTGSAGGVMQFANGGTVKGNVGVQSGGFGFGGGFRDPDLFVTTGGDVAIGGTTADPLSLTFTGKGLALNEDSGTAFFQIDSGNGSRIDFGVGGTRNFVIYSDASNYSEFKRTTNHPLVFGTNNTERMRILGGGGLQLAAGNNISNASGDFTLDVAGDITLDAGAENIKFHDDGTEVGQIDLGSSNMTIRSSVQDKNTIFRGNDGGTEIEAMRIDFAEGGRVGIGTTSPAVKLGVSGAIIASDNITAYGTPSDIRLKENIEVIDNALDKVKQLKGITYDLKSDGNRLTGLIAQDLEKVLPEAVYETSAVDDADDKHLAIRYGNTVGLLVEAIKELEARVKELEGK